MDYDKGLVAAVLREGELALRRVRDKIHDRETLLQGQGKEAYDFVIDYYSQYGEIPHPNIVVQKTGVDLDPDPIGKGSDISGPADWWADQILARRLHKCLQDASRDMLEHIDDDPAAALDSIEKSLHGIRQERITAGNKIETLGPLGKEVMEYYQAVKGGMRGVLTPWATMNEDTFGFWPQDLAVFVARVGIGKTWTAVLLALHAWRNGHPVLFATTEISQVRIAMRLISAHYRLPYDHLRKGRLGAFGEKKLEQGIKEIMDDEKFHVAGGDFDFRVESFSNALADIDPELTILDGAYLLRVEGKTRTEQASNAFNELKRLANRHSSPMIVTMQFNRQVKANVASSADIGNIALTDVAAWNADLGYALVQTDDMKKNKTMTFKPMKVREGTGEPFDVTWDLDTMNFPEQPKGVEGGGDADEGFGANPEEVVGDDDSDMPF